MQHSQEPILCDLAIVGGRVIDPETRRDELATVAITGTQITAVTRDPVAATHVHDATGMVVAPGWIDLHSHAQSVAGSRLQARDGVTTALDLEGGFTEVASWYDRVALEGRAIHYGASAAWQHARMIEVGGLSIADLVNPLEHFGDPRWKAQSTQRQHDQLLERIARDLDAGAIGVGVLMGYAPRVDPEEYQAVSQLAARHGVATFTHARDLVEQVPDGVVDGAEEIVRAATETGVRAHYCHVNSTSTHHIDRVHRLLELSSSPVTSEAYPYGAGATAISADFLAPERLAERGLTPSSLVHSPTGQRVRDVAHLRQLREEDPGSVAIVHFLEDSRAKDRAVLDRCFAFPGTVVASDAMPLQWPVEQTDPHAWPPPPDTRLHPRTAGTFSRFWRQYVRETASISVVDAVRRCSLGPAQILEPFVPGMAAKGRLQPGCDADVVVFSPDRVSDRATYDQGSLASTGYARVIVGGTVVVQDDRLVLDELPGRPVRAGR